MTDNDYQPRHAIPAIPAQRTIPAQAVAELLSSIRAILPTHTLEIGVSAVRITIGNILSEGVSEFSVTTTAAFLRDDFTDMVIAANAQAAEEMAS